MLRQSPPKTIDELMQRCQQIAGKSLGEIAQELSCAVPADLMRNKGWVGQLLEACLGADAGNQAEPVPGPGDAGVDQLPRDDGVGSRRQREQHMLEFRTLRLVNGHGEGGRRRIKPRRQHLTHAVALREADPQPPSLVGQRQPQIAIVEPELRVVVRHHHRAPGEPAVGARDPVGLRHRQGDGDAAGRAGAGRDARR